MVSTEKPAVGMWQLPLTAATVFRVRLFALDRAVLVAGLVNVVPLPV